jgi:hypothetical protein
VKPSTGNRTCSTNSCNFLPRNEALMSFWSTFGDLVKVFAPLILTAVVPGGAILGPLVADAIAMAEDTLGPGTGPQKKASVQKVVGDGVTIVNAVKGTVVLDPAIVTQQVGTAIDLIIGIINEVQKAQAAHAPSGPMP